MAIYLLYWGLLLLWVALLWPLYRLRGGARLWLAVVVVAGLAALIHEIRMYFWVPAAIRLDILLISVALACLYGSAVAVLFLKRWRRVAISLTALIVLTGGGMSYAWFQASREADRLAGVLGESNRLLFEAKFRSQQAYDSYFGPFDADSGSYPTGHWRFEGPSHFTRLIVNSNGHVWLFHHCQENAECHSRSRGPGLRQDADSPQRWDARLAPQAGVPFEIRIARTSPERLALEARGHRVEAVRAPPPVARDPPARTLRFLGSYSSAECSGPHVTVRQIWLWEDETRRHAVGVFATIVAGRQNDFLSPVVMGTGIRENAGWRFNWNRAAGAGTAIVAIDGGKAFLTLDLEGRDLEDVEAAVLAGGSVFRDERIALAPLTTGGDWRRWFDTVLTGHFVSGPAPEC